MDALEYWASGAGLAHITPPRAPNPETLEFADIIRAWTARRTVLDFGCGIGRLAGLFHEALYIGVDVCAIALNQARLQHPSHKFNLIGDSGPLPSSDAVFAHNVLMHVPDDRLTGTIARFRSTSVIVSEILGRKWRGPGYPPVFNREFEEYESAFFPLKIKRTALMPCAHYPGTDLTIVEFS